MAQAANRSPASSIALPKADVSYGAAPKTKAVEKTVDGIFFHDSLFLIEQKVGMRKRRVYKTKFSKKDTTFIVWGLVATNNLANLNITDSLLLKKGSQVKKIGEFKNKFNREQINTQSQLISGSWKVAKSMKPGRYIIAIYQGGKPVTQFEFELLK